MLKICIRIRGSRHTVPPKKKISFLYYMPNVNMNGKRGSSTNWRSGFQETRDFQKRLNDGKWINQHRHYSPEQIQGTWSGEWCFLALEPHRLHTCVGLGDQEKEDGRKYGNILKAAAAGILTCFPFNHPPL